MNKKNVAIVACVLLAAGCSKAKAEPYQFAIDAVKTKQDFDRHYWAVKYDKTGNPSDSVATAQIEVAVADKIDSPTEKGYNVTHIPPGMVAAVVCWVDTKGASQMSIFDLATQKEFETRAWGPQNCEL